MILTWMFGKKWFDTPYKTYENIFKIGILLIIISIVSAVVSVQIPFDISSWISISIVVCGFIGVILCVYSGIKGMKILYNGKAYDNKEKQLLGKAALFAMVITIILSIILVYIIDYLEYDFSTRTMIIIPVTLLTVCTSLFFSYFKKTNDNYQ